MKNWFKEWIWATEDAGLLAFVAVPIIILCMWVAQQHAAIILPPSVNALAVGFAVGILLFVFKLLRHIIWDN